MTQKEYYTYNLDVSVMTTSQHTSDNDAFVLLENLTRFKVIFKNKLSEKLLRKGASAFSKGTFENFLL